MHLSEAEPTVNNTLVFKLGHWRPNWSRFKLGTPDPFKLKTGGVVNMKRIKDRNRDMTADEINLNSISIQLLFI